MERVMFLVEKTSQRISCLLNPESVVARRTAGVKPRLAGNRPLTGAKLKDDPLLFTGGGTTELTLDLLFDVNLGGSSITTTDVRELTGPIWAMAETAISDQGYGAPPLVRFLWGKYWNFLGVVVAVAERLEYFTAEGAPGRSWLRMKMLRTAEPAGDGDDGDSLLGGDAPGAPDSDDVEPDEVLVHQVTAEGSDPGDDQGSAVARLDVIAHQYCGFPWWKSIAEFNDIDDPTRVQSGTLLRIPLDWISGSNS